MSEVINSNQVIQRPEIVLDPVFALPPGLVGVRSATQAETGTPEGQNLGQDFSEDGAEEGNIVIDLAAPQTITIVSRTTRVRSDNTVVVDVVIETPDIKGVTDFETRITKV